MNDPIIESGGWNSKKEADQQAAGGMLSIAGFMVAGSALSVYLSVVGSLWWLAAAAVLGFLAVRMWSRVRKLEREMAKESSAKDDDDLSRMT